MNPDELRDAIEAAFDFRGDARLTLRSGEVVEGYLFDRRLGATLEDSSSASFPRPPR
jgi:hypothetical protein